MNKYLAIGHDGDGMFVEQYKVEAFNAKGALKQAMIRNNLDGGYDMKSAIRMAINDLWSFKRATCSTGKAWTGANESPFCHWIIIQR